MNLSLFNSNAQTVNLQLPSVVPKCGVTFQSFCISEIKNVSENQAFWCPEK